eukprot:1047977-Rhodomonas_salina.3
MPDAIRLFVSFPATPCFATSILACTENITANPHKKYPTQQWNVREEEAVSWLACSALLNLYLTRTLGPERQLW